MDRNCPPLESHLSLHDFVHEHLLQGGLRGHVVIRGDQIVGFITPNEVKQVARELGPQTSVQGVMRPLEKLNTVAPDTPAQLALQTMGREDVNQLPVVSNGRIEGIFSRSHVLHFLQTHAELHRG